MRSVVFFLVVTCTSILVGCPSSEENNASDKFDNTIWKKRETKLGYTKYVTIQNDKIFACNEDSKSHYSDDISSISPAQFTEVSNKDKYTVSGSVMEQTGSEKDVSYTVTYDKVTDTESIPGWCLSQWTGLNWKKFW